MSPSTAIFYISALFLLIVNVLGDDVVKSRVGRQTSSAQRTTVWFQNEPYVVRNLTLNSPANTPLIRVEARASGSGRVLYNVENTALFRVDSDTGLVYTNVPASRLFKTNQLNFTVMAVNSDSDGRMASTIVRIAGNRAPRFPDDVYTAEVHEDAGGGSLVLAVLAQDTDTLSYSVYHRNNHSRDSQYEMFTVNEKTGVIRLTTSPFSFARATYKFDVIAVDLHGDNDTALVRVQVVDKNDHRPVFPNCDQYHPTVAENTLRGEYVVQVTATDEDSGKNAEIIYSLVTSPGVRWEAFQIDNTTGRITTYRPFNRDDPDNEKTLRVLVKARDRGSPPLEGTCSFEVIVQDVNDNRPLFDKVRYDESISKSTPPDSAIMRVSATDEDSDENADLVYSLNVTNPRDSGFFHIDPGSGIVRLISSLEQVPLNYAFRLNAIAQDRGSPPQWSQVKVSITVKDSSARPPTFTVRPNLTYYLPERYADTETAIARVEAVADPPGSRRIYYELVRGSQEQTNKLRTFRLEEDQMGGAYIKFGGSHDLDYEKIRQYNLTVRATTDDQTSAEMTFGIVITDKNDESPIFFETESVVIQENSPVGTPVVTVRAVDNDGTSPNNKVHFRLDPDSKESRLFAIDSESGLITTRVEFDREDRSRPSPFYTVTVIAEDGAPSDIRIGGAPNRETGRVSVEIGDMNDNPPTFNSSAIYRSSVDENSDVGTKVYDVVATDPDIDSELRYLITGGNTDAAFAVEPATGTVFVKNTLDYERMSSYVLNVTASDGIFEASHLVYIDVNNVNDMAPIFEKGEYKRKAEEGSFSDEPLIKVTATDPDPIGRPNIVYQLSNQDNGADEIFEINEEGEIRVRTALDRDAGTGGREVWEISVMAFDDGAEGLGSSTTFQLTLMDINDNAPYIVQSESSLPVITENKDFAGISFAVEADDFDDHKVNGPPYTFRLDPAAPAVIRSKFEVEQTAGQNGAVIRPLVTFDREQQKKYRIPVLVADSSGARPRQLTGTSMFSVVIGDENDNDMGPGSSAIQVFNFEGKMPSTVIGRVYVDDPDDWDLPDKTFSWLKGEAYGNFLLDPDTGDITMLQGTQNGTYHLRFHVYDRKFQSTVEADVTVLVKLIPRRAVAQSGSLRFSATTAEAFISPPSPDTPSMYARLIDYLAALFETDRDNVEVFGVQNNDKDGVDVRYSAHGSPYYTSEKMDGFLSQKIPELEKALGVKVEQVGINDCMLESTCPDSCYSTLEIYENQVHQVRTNTSSLIGVRTELLYHCGKCEPPLERQICLNDGRWNPDTYKCECPPGYDGDNCEGLYVHFDGSGFGWYPPLSVCNVSVLSFNVRTRDDKSLLLYSGPTTQYFTTVADFLAVQLVEGRIRVLLNLGSGTAVASLDSLISDGQSHHVQLSWGSGRLQIQLDGCSNSSASCSHSVPTVGSNRQLNVAAWPLQLGGTQQQLQQLAQLLDWREVEEQRSFAGCLHNLTYNNKVYDLSHPGYGLGYSSQCSPVAPATAVINLTANFVAIIASCLLLLFLLLLAVVMCRRRRAGPLYKEPMDELRDTIINYEDEGGGEKDQTAFDLSVLQVPNGQQNGSVAATPSVRDFIDDNKDRMDCDGRAWPPDDVRNYAYEGGGSQAGSLSSLNSGTTDSDLDFEYLKDMDPRFRRLAEMYGGEDDDEDPADSVREGAYGPSGRDSAKAGSGVAGSNMVPSVRPSSMAGESWC